jgi:predicted RNase H-like HicB family nuclease
MALLAVWTPQNENESFGCTIPGFSGTNSAGESLEDCVKNVQEAFDMMTEDRPLKQEDLAELINPKHMLHHEDDILVNCWWKVVLLEATVEEDVELDFDYLAQRDALRDVEAELAESMVGAK